MNPSLIQQLSFVLANWPLAAFLLSLLLLLLLSRIPMFGTAKAKPAVYSLTVGLLAAVIIAHAAYALIYLFYPSYLDHVAPGMVIDSFLFSIGQPLYLEQGSPYLYSFTYGVAGHFLNAVAYWLFGAGIFTSKLMGVVCLVLAACATAITVRRLVPGKVYVLAALGYFSGVSLFFRNISFWVRPDPLMMLMVSLGGLSLVLQPGIASALLCGVALGGIAGAKIHGAAYLLPVLAVHVVKGGWKSLATIIPTAGLVFAMPYVLFDNVSFVNHIGLIARTAEHGLSLRLFLQSLGVVLFMLLPFLIYGFSRREASGYWFKYLTGRRLEVGAAFISALAILLVSSKPGAGAHHFLPFVPLLSVLFALILRNVSDAEKQDEIVRKIFWLPLYAFLIAALPRIYLSLYYGISISTDHSLADSIRLDIAAILDGYPEHNIYMGYGDDASYPATFLRTDLVFSGQPYLIDASILIDYQLSGAEIPVATMDYMNSDGGSIWLIPRETVPWSMTNWYLRPTTKLLFGQPFRENFSNEFSLMGQSTHFDLWFRDGGPLPRQQAN